MHSVRKPWWQQATALVTVTTGGMITGFNFVPGAAATMTSPTSVPLHLLALEQAARPGAALNARAVGGDSADSATADALLRSAIVNVAKYYLQIAATRSPAQMEALIWDNTSLNGADHGPSCAAFASLTLELAAQAVGQQSWVSGGSSYPYPLPAWADVRVDTNPASPAVASVTADAQAHRRWHPIGDGYRPQPGDWVLFEHHVEVVTRDADGVLDTIGADSDPGLTVNAHSYSGTLADDGVVGFVDNGHLAAASFDGTSATATAARAAAGGTPSAATPAASASAGKQSGTHSSPSAPVKGGEAIVPGIAQPTDATGAAISGTRSATQAPGPASARQAPGTASATQTPKAPTHAAADHAAAGHGSPPTASAAAVPGVVQPAGVGIGSGSSAEAGTQALEARGHAAAIPGTDIPAHAATASRSAGVAAVPGASPAAFAPASGPSTQPTAATPGAATPPAATPSATAAPASHDSSATAKPEQYRQYAAAAQATPGTRAQQAFISLIAPGAVAAQQRWGVPAAVTIAQAIEESAWGNSQLAAQYHNLFGIKGSGPAGSVALPTSEFYNGHWVTIDGQFRVYHNVAESIADHAELLATSGYYQRAMADRAIADAFANDLTGVYATDPDYGANLIAIMKLYNLYRFDAPVQSVQPQSAQASTPAAAQPTATAQHTTPAQPVPAVQPTTAQRTTAAQPTTAVSPTTAAQPTNTQPAATAQPAAGQPAAVHSSAGPATAEGHPADGQATIPGLGSPALAPTAAAPAEPTHGARPAAQIPGVVAPTGVTAGSSAATPRAAASSARGGASIPGLPAAAATNYQRQPVAAATTAARYQPQFTTAFTTAYFATAKGPLGHGEHLYRDVAGQTGVRWELLAACDWMQCKAHPRYSPVHGEKIGALNSDGTSYATKSAALAQCASDLVELAAAVYGIDLTARRTLSVRALADAFAAFRWGALLVRHGVSAMEFPYAVAGLTAQHQKMHWPVIDDPAAPDRPGARFREPFGAVPVVLSLDYPATVLADRKRR